MEVKLILLLINKLKDEECRRHLIILLLIPLITILVILTMAVYILASPLMLLNPYVSGDNEYLLMQSFKGEYDSLVNEYIDLSFNGIYPLPFDHDGNVFITDNYGYRIHPITGEYRMHWGIDFGTTHHCEIKSIANGTVTFAGVYGTYGNTVIIKHETLAETFYSQYSHLSEVDMAEGQIVKQGEVIGLEGGAADDPNPGDSTGHHLHFGVKNANGDYVNPAGYLYIDN